jgi:hypothetical protein
VWDRVVGAVAQGLGRQQGGENAQRQQCGRDEPRRRDAAPYDAQRPHGGQLQRRPQRDLTAQQQHRQPAWAVLQRKVPCRLLTRMAGLLDLKRVRSAAQPDNVGQRFGVEDPVGERHPGERQHGHAQWAIEGRQAGCRRTCHASAKLTHRTARVNPRVGAGLRDRAARAWHAANPLPARLPRAEIHNDG